MALTFQLRADKDDDVDGYDGSSGGGIDYRQRRVNWIFWRS